MLLLSRRCSTRTSRRRRHRFIWFPFSACFLAAVLLGERLNILASVGPAIVRVAAIRIMKYDSSC
jgi:hypothetical protein